GSHKGRTCLKYGGPDGPVGSQGIPDRDGRRKNYCGTFLSHNLPKVKM
ncbi:hypothetical protein AVDCRST_MAG81-856, partial [uncultured Synechococcales cyanobacterium]